MLRLRPKPLKAMSEIEQWQRLAPMALVFLVLSAIQKFVRENLFLFAGAGVGVAVVDGLGAREFLLIGAGLLLFSILGAVIYHRRFRFRIEDDAVRLRRGLLEKKELRVRFARIQNIQLGQPFYFRPFGLVRFSLETPGGQAKEVDLPGIPRALAEQLRDRIAGVQKETGTALEGEESELESSAEAAVSDQQALLFSASPWRLFVHGLSSNQVWLLAGLAAWIFGSLNDRIDDWLSDTALFNWLGAHVDSLLLLVAGGLVLGLSVLMLLSGVLAIVRFHRFRLFDRGDRLVSVGGLLDEREQTVKREKITGLTLRQSAFGRALGCWSMVLRQTSSMEEEMPGKRSGFLVPGMRAEDQSLVSRMVSGWNVPETLDAISPGFRRLYWLRGLLLGVGAMLVSLVAFGRQDWLLLLIGAFMLALLVAVHRRWRSWGWSARGRLIWVRQGFIGQHLDGFDLDRVQQVQVRQSPYQRRHGLASLYLALPQGSVTIPFIDLERAADLANLAAFTAETAAVHRV